MISFLKSFCLTLAGLTAVTLPVMAQVRVVNGVVIRADLKARIPNPPSAFASAPSSGASAPAKRCDTNNVCQTPLLVTPGGLDRVTLTWDPNGCSVYFPYAEIRIKKGSQPTLRWVLVTDPTDPAKYEFDMQYGIEPFGNEPKTGLFKGFREPSSTAFVFTNLNLKPSTISFYPNVSRVDKAGKATACNIADPFVVNEN